MRSLMLRCSGAPPPPRRGAACCSVGDIQLGLLERRTAHGRALERHAVGRPSGERYAGRRAERGERAARGERRAGRCAASGPQAGKCAASGTRAGERPAARGQVRGERRAARGQVALNGCERLDGEWREEMGAQLRGDLPKASHPIRIRASPGARTCAAYSRPPGSARARAAHALCSAPCPDPSSSPLSLIFPACYGRGATVRGGGALVVELKSA